MEDWRETRDVRKLIAVLAGAAIVASMAGCSSQVGGENESGYTQAHLLMSTTVGDNSNSARMCVLFAEMVSEATDGAVTVDVFTSDQLSGGDMAKGIDMLSSGGTSCAFEPVDSLAALDERLMTLNIAWTFDSYEQAEEMLNGSAGEYIADLLEPKGLTTLGFIHNGMRQLTNATRTVTIPEDLEGIKIRVPGGEPFMQAFTLMGADPLTMSFSELYTGMSQGTVDGQENGYDLIYNNSFYEVQPYITEWNYSYGAFALVFNSEIWNSLNEQTQQAIQEVADEVCATGNANVVNSEAEQRQAILDYGCEITVPTEEQIKAFQDVLVEQGYYEYFYNKYGADAFVAFGIDIESLRA